MSWEASLIDNVAVVFMKGDRVNSQGPEFFWNLINTITEVERNDKVLSVVLTSASSVFSAGFNLDFWKPLLRAGDFQATRTSYRLFMEACLRLSMLPKPTVAAVNGHALGGGMLVALCCDFRLAAGENTRLGLTEISVGLSVTAGMGKIVRMAVGEVMARRMILGGRIYSPVSAFEAGIVDDIAEPETLLDDAIVRAKAINSDTLSAYAASKATLQKELAKQLQQLEDDDLHLIVKQWFSPEATRAIERASQSIKRQTLV